MGFWYFADVERVCHVVICRTLWLTIAPSFHKQHITASAWKNGCCNKEKLAVYSESHSSPTILDTYWGPVKRKREIISHSLHLFLERLAIVLFSLLYNTSRLGLVYIFFVFMCWCDSTPGMVRNPSLRAGTSSSLPSVPPHWIYSGPRAAGLARRSTFCVVWKEVAVGLQGLTAVFFMGGFGICQVRTNTAIVVCLRWHLASYLIADVLSGLHCRHISLKTFIASRNVLKSGGRGTL